MNFSRPVGLGRNNRLLVGAMSGEVVRAAEYSTRRWRAVNAEPRGREGPAHHDPIVFPARSTGNAS